MPQCGAGFQPNVAPRFALVNLSKQVHQRHVALDFRPRSPADSHAHCASNSVVPGLSQAQPCLRFMPHRTSLGLGPKCPFFFPAVAPERHRKPMPIHTPCRLGSPQRPPGPRQSPPCLRERIGDERLGCEGAAKTPHKDGNPPHPIAPRSLSHHTAKGTDSFSGSPHTSSPQHEG